MVGNMKELWKWFEYWDLRSNRYMSGKPARMNNGVFEADCNQIIKAFGWTGGDPSKVSEIGHNTYNYNGNGVADEWIGTWFAKAKNKGENLDNLPTEGYCLVYIDNPTHSHRWEHVGIYCAATNETFEMCGGSINGIRRMALNRNYWNKWSELYWCNNFVENDKPAATENEENEDYDKNTIENRFIVKDRSGKQLDCFTVYKNAVRRAEGAGGVIIDRTNGKQIYPAAIENDKPDVAENEDYDKSAIENRFIVKDRSGKQLDCFTVYKNAVRRAEGAGGVIIDRTYGKQIYP